MKKIMVTGITGFVGSRLSRELLARGYEVHALVRDPSRLKWTHPQLHLHSGDVRDLQSVVDAMRGCEVAVDLIHGLGEPHSFEYEECRAAQVFTQASQLAGVLKILYLGGLGPKGELSPHLRSRHLTGEILRLGRAPVIEFRASIVLGNGSTSYEMLKALASRLPVFLDPKNLRERCQPIHEDDLIQYLLGGIALPVDQSRIFEIGGTDQISYAELLLKIAHHSGIFRRVIPVPELDLRLMMESFELIVPEYARVGRHLMESLTYPTVVTNSDAKETFPEIQPIGIDESLTLIGVIHSDVKTLVSREHTQKIFRGIVERFPNLRWISLLSDKISG